MTDVVKKIKKYFEKKDYKNELVVNFQDAITRIDNDFISPNSIVIDNSVTGNIYSSKEIIIIETAEVIGNVNSAICTIRGKVFGDIVALDYADIKASANIDGNIKAKEIQIEQGAIINGSVKIEGNIDNPELSTKVKIAVSMKPLQPISRPLSGSVSGMSESNDKRAESTKKVKVKKEETIKKVEKEETVSDRWY